MSVHAVLAVSVSCRLASNLSPVLSTDSFKLLGAVVRARSSSCLWSRRRRTSLSRVRFTADWSTYSMKPPRSCEGLPNRIAYPLSFFCPFSAVLISIGETRDRTSCLLLGVCCLLLCFTFLRLKLFLLFLPVAGLRT